jgi:hypothetical protein
MKIAICLYGQPRLYKKGYNNIAIFVDLNNTHSFDFYFHTWFDEKMVGLHYECAPWRNISKNDLEIKKNTVNELLELYKPKKYLYESPIKFDITPYISTYIYSIDTPINKKNINNTISCLYSKYQVAQMLSSDNIYDFVISIRFDFLNKLYFRIEDMKKNVINCMNVSPRLYVTDHLIVTSYDLFILYSSTYVNLLTILNNDSDTKYLNEVGCGVAIVNEALITSNLKKYYNNLHSVIYLNNKIPNFV